MDNRSMKQCVIGLSLLALAGTALAQGAYFPPAGNWAHKDPAALGLDPVKLAEAVAYAQAHETARALDFSDQDKTFGTRLGSMPTRRAHTNGVVIYKGFVVATFGETSAVDPTYSVAKSMLATVAGIGVREGRIASVLEPVGKTIRGSPGSTTCSRSRSGRAACGARMRTSSVPSSSVQANASRVPLPLPARCSNTTTCASTALRCRCCACSTAPCRTSFRMK
jgi:hypothetical protein